MEMVWEWIIVYSVERDDLLLGGEGLQIGDAGIQVLHLKNMHALFDSIIKKGHEKIKSTFQKNLPLYSNISTEV